MPRSATDALVIGWGNRLRGDDAAGLLVAEEIEALARPGVRVETVRLLTPELAFDLSGCNAAVLIDADAEASEVSVREVEPCGTVRGAATHALTAGQLLALCETVYGVRPRTWLVAVPGAQFEVGDPLSPRTRAAVETAVEIVLDVLAGG
jgi:hydrogenase maturation protease